MFYSSSGCPETTVNAFETKERQFSQNEIYHTTELCSVEISNPWKQVSFGKILLLGVTPSQPTAAWKK